MGAAGVEREPSSACVQVADTLAEAITEIGDDDAVCEAFSIDYQHEPGDNALALDSLLSDFEHETE